jgi:hypothetical protein
MDHDLPLIDMSPSPRDKDEIGHRANILHILYAIFLQGPGSKSFFIN